MKSKMKIDPVCRRFRWMGSELDTVGHHLKSVDNNDVFDCHPTPFTGIF